MSVEPSQFLLTFLKTIERLRLTMYLDAGGKPTIGWGHLLLPRESHGPITPDVANEYLRKDVMIAIDGVMNATEKVHLLVHEVEALTSFTFNVGVRNFEGSTLRAKILAGDLKAASWQFRLWWKANGKTQPGLRRRRIAEELWFLGGSPDSVLNILRGTWE